MVSKKIIPVIFLLVFGIVNTGQSSEYYTYEQSTFTISVPKTWHKIPQQYLDAFAEQIRMQSRNNPSLKPDWAVYDCGFQKNSPDYGITPPVIIIKTDHNPELARILNHDLNAMGKEKVSLTYQQLCKLLPSVIPQIIDSSARNIIFNKRKQMLRFSLDVTDGATHVKTLTSLYLSEDTIYHIICTTLANIYSQDKKTFLHMSNSFKTTKHVPKDRQTSSYKITKKPPISTNYKYNEARSIAKFKQDIQKFYRARETQEKLDTNGDKTRLEYQLGNKDESISVQQKEDQLKELQEEIELLNATLPKMISKEMQLTMVNVRSYNEIAYIMKSLLFKVEDVDISLIEAKLKPYSTNMISSNPDTREFIKRGISYTYVIYDKNNKYIGEYSVTPEDCGFDINNQRTNRQTDYKNNVESKEAQEKLEMNEPVTGLAQGQFRDPIPEDEQFTTEMVGVWKEFYEKEGLEIECLIVYYPDHTYEQYTTYLTDYDAPWRSTGIWMVRGGYVYYKGKDEISSIRIVSIDQQKASYVWDDGNTCEGYRIDLHNEGLFKRKNDLGFDADGNVDIYKGKSTSSLHQKASMTNAFGLMIKDMIDNYSVFDKSRAINILQDWTNKEEDNAKVISLSVKDNSSSHYKQTYLVTYTIVRGSNQNEYMYEYNLNTNAIQRMVQMHDED